MDGLMSGLKIDSWYKALIAASLVVLIAALTANRNDVALIAAGALIFGFGEWINHPKRSGVVPGYIITSTARDASAFGLLLDGAGIALVLFGAYRCLDL